MLLKMDFDEKRREFLSPLGKEVGEAGTSEAGWDEERGAGGASKGEECPDGGREMREGNGREARGDERREGKEEIGLARRGVLGIVALAAADLLAACAGAVTVKPNISKSSMPVKESANFDVLRAHWIEAFELLDIFFRYFEKLDNMELGKSKRDALAFIRKIDDKLEENAIIRANLKLMESGGLKEAVLTFEEAYLEPVTARYRALKERVEAAEVKESEPVEKKSSLRSGWL